ncbi:hypothetical protein Xclt_03090, partial [Xanthomonas axonopodis pv. clitoriae]
AETYLTQQVVGTSTHKDFKTSNSTSTFDAWGKLLSVRENTPGGKVDDRLRYFTMDAEGNILRRTEGTFKNGVFEQDDAARLRTEHMRLPTASTSRPAVSTARPTCWGR